MGIFVVSAGDIIMVEHFLRLLGLSIKCTLSSPENGHSWVFGRPFLVFQRACVQVDRQLDYVACRFDRQL